MPEETQNVHGRDNVTKIGSLTDARTFQLKWPAETQINQPTDPASCVKPGSGLKMSQEAWAGRSYMCVKVGTPGNKGRAG